MTFKEGASAEYMSNVISVLTAYASGDLDLTDNVMEEFVGDRDFLEHAVAMLYAMTNLVALAQGYSVEEALQIYAKRVILDEQ